MWRDPIVEEVRKVREERARRFDYDIAAIVRDLQARQEAGGARVVDRSTRSKDDAPGSRRIAARPAPRRPRKSGSRKPTRGARR